MITERLMSLGSWSLKLSDRTPQRVLEQLALTLTSTSTGTTNGRWGTIAVTPAEVPGASQTDASTSTVAALAVLASSVYSGMLLKSDGLTISGEHVTAWLGQSSGVGAMTGALVSTPGTSCFNFLSYLVGPGGAPFALPQSLTVHTTNAWPAWIGGTLTFYGWNQLKGTHKDVLDAAANRVNSMSPTGTTWPNLWEWRVGHDMVVRGNTATAIYGDPGVLLTDAADVGSSQPVPGVGGGGYPVLGPTISPVTHAIGARIAQTVDISDMASRVWANIGIAGVETSTTTGGQGFAVDGQAIDRQIVASGSDSTLTDSTRRSNAERINRSAPRETLTVEIDGHTLPWVVPVGSQVWLSAQGWWTKPPVVASDEQMVPIDGGMMARRYRLVESTWPVVQGCGVYFLPNRSLPANPRGVIDLTPWVEFETGATRLTVGERPKPPSWAASKPTLMI